MSHEYDGTHPPHRVVYYLLFKTTNAQYINSNVCFVKYSDIFRCIYFIFKESFLIYAKVTKSINYFKRFDFCSVGRVA